MCSCIFLFAVNQIFKIACSEDIIDCCLIKGATGGLENTILTCSNKHESYTLYMYLDTVIPFKHVCIGLRGQLLFFKEGVTLLFRPPSDPLN